MTTSRRYPANRQFKRQAAWRHTTTPASSLTEADFLMSRAIFQNFLTATTTQWQHLLDVYNTRPVPSKFDRSQGVRAPGFVLKTQRLPPTDLMTKRAWIPHVDPWRPICSSQPGSDLQLSCPEPVDTFGTVEVTTTCSPTRKPAVFKTVAPLATTALAFWAGVAGLASADHFEIVSSQSDFDNAAKTREWTSTSTPRMFKKTPETGHLLPDMWPSGNTCNHAIQTPSSLTFTTHRNPCQAAWQRFIRFCISSGRSPPRWRPRCAQNPRA